MEQIGLPNISSYDLADLLEEEIELLEKSLHELQRIVDTVNPACQDSDETISNQPKIIPVLPGYMFGYKQSSENPENPIFMASLIEAVSTLSDKTENLNTDLSFDILQRKTQSLPWPSIWNIILQEDTNNSNSVSFLKAVDLEFYSLEERDSQKLLFMVMVRKTIEFLTNWISNKQREGRTYKASPFYKKLLYLAQTNNFLDGGFSQFKKIFAASFRSEIKEYTIDHQLTNANKVLEDLFQNYGLKF